MLASCCGPSSSSPTGTAGIIFEKPFAFLDFLDHCERHTCNKVSRMHHPPPPGASNPKTPCLPQRSSAQIVQGPAPRGAHATHEAHHLVHNTAEHGFEVIAASITVDAGTARQKKAHEHQQASLKARPMTPRLCNARVMPTMLSALIAER